ncbi:hypothetical protein HDU96_010789, partial [Phlyctochytrium bullatum]
MATPEEQQLIAMMDSIAALGFEVARTLHHEILLTEFLRDAHRAYSFDLVELLHDHAPWALPFLPLELQSPPEPAADTAPEEVEGVRFLGHEELVEANEHASELVDEGFCDDEVFQPVQQDPAEVDALELATEMDPEVQQWLLDQVQGPAEEIDVQEEHVEELVEPVQPPDEVEHPQPEYDDDEDDDDEEYEYEYVPVDDDHPYWYIEEPNVKRELKGRKRLREGITLGFQTKKRRKMARCLYTFTVDVAYEAAYLNSIWSELAPDDEDPAPWVVDGDPVQPSMPVEFDAGEEERNDTTNVDRIGPTDDGQPDMHQEVDVEDPAPVPPPPQPSDPHPAYVHAFIQAQRRTNPNAPHWYFTSPAANRPPKPRNRPRDGGAYVPYHRRKRTKLRRCRFACRVPFSDDTAGPTSFWAKLDPVDAEERDSGSSNMIHVLTSLIPQAYPLYMSPADPFSEEEELEELEALLGPQDHVHPGPVAAPPLRAAITTSRPGNAPNPTAPTCHRLQPPLSAAATTVTTTTITTIGRGIAQNPTTLSTPPKATATATTTTIGRGIAQNPTTLRTPPKATATATTTTIGRVHGSAPSLITPTYPRLKTAPTTAAAAAVI